jgi:hypothetical protein
MPKRGPRRGVTLGSETATPSISPLRSCSAARSEAPPPLETLEAMTIVLSGGIVRWRLPERCASPNRSLSTKKASSIERSTSRPQSCSGFCPEWACFQAKRSGVSALKAARAASDSRAVKLEPAPAASASARTPVIRLTRSFCRSCAPMPVPLSV